MSDDLEKEIALYEAERNRAWHSWFANRGDVSPSDEHTRIFDGGFRMAWELCRAQPAPQPAEQEPIRNDKVRAEFEAWASTHFFLQEEDTIIDDSDEYISVDMQLAWEAWYASRAAPDVAQLVEALEEGLRAIGDHHAPGDCYATGPMTGDPFRDLVQCPACSFIAMCDDLLAAYRKGGEV